MLYGPSAGEILRAGARLVAFSLAASPRTSVVPGDGH